MLTAKLTREHLSVIAAVSVAGDLVTAVQGQPFNSLGIVSFLKRLQEQVGEKLLVIGDGAPIHRSRVVKEYLSTQEGKGLRLVQLPGYAPELNPVELVWRHLKHVELPNRSCQDLEHLEEELQAAIGRADANDALIWGCLDHAGYL